MTVYKYDTGKIYQDNCLEVMRTIPDDSIDSIVTDPPYGINYLNSKWDYDIPSAETFEECLRVLKPGAHILCFCGTRTQHRMAINIEDAGFDIRDIMAWIYGSGFKKGTDIAKGITKMAKVAKTQDATKWAGWGTGLRPSIELITLARKSLAAGTVVKNVLKHSTGALNLGACMIKVSKNAQGQNVKAQGQGRFPANVMLEEVECVLTKFPTTSSSRPRKFCHNSHTKKQRTYRGLLENMTRDTNRHDSGTASRFFKNIKPENNIPFIYNPKSSPTDRNSGLNGGINTHPTVKPIKLIQELQRLITPPGGIALDPFLGSGTAGIAALHERFDFIGVERDQEFFEIAKKRISNTTRTHKQTKLFT